MNLRLVLENAPHAQAVMEKEYGGGRMVIGRSDEADWQLVDPDMFVSRSHAVITEEGGRIMVTDASSGGLYIDNAANPVGTGNAVPLEPGMRLRLGDFVLRVEEITVRTAVGQQPPPRSGGGVFSFEFGAPEATEPAPKRPATLPDPFGLRSDDRSGVKLGGGDAEKDAGPRPLDQDDPFELDLRGAKAAPAAPAEREETGSRASADRGSGGSGGFGGYFGGAPKVEQATDEDDDDWMPQISTESPQRERVRGADRQEGADPQASDDHDWAKIAEEADPAAVTPEVRDPFGLMDDGPAQVAEREPTRTGGAGTPSHPEPRVSPAPEPGPQGRPDPEPEPVVIVQPEPRPDPQPSPGAAGGGGVEPHPTPAPRPAPVAADDSALRAAFYRGMGVDPARVPTGDPEEEMERIGRCLRAMTEGVMALLRTRAEEKQRVRVAQTIIASANVNPLKFLATTEDGLASLLQPRGEGYLAPEDAVDWAFRDLNDHQVRTWTALQSALRRMIDSFDPAEIEKEMKDAGLLEKLLAGGSSAKMWQLYEERYREIARSAEERFLGEVGADFRDAYENQGRS